MADEARWPKMIRCDAARPEDNNSSVTRCNYIDRLCDELLKEILLRLPNCKYVIQTKFVCKRWNALTSHPNFSVDFVLFKQQNAHVHGLNNRLETSAFVMQYEPDLFRKLWQIQKYQKFFRPSILYVQDSSFSPLHILEDESAKPPVPVASCQDLLLYCRNENNEKYGYYISNVQTKEWVMLPLSYCKKDPRLKPHIVGFICDPIYSNGREITYHYSVVVVCGLWARSTNKLCAHLFSSRCDTQWCDKVLCLPQLCELLPPCSSRSFCFYFDGKLHYTCRQGFFGFDHNSIGSEDEIQCHLTPWPVGMLHGGLRMCVSQGRLHISVFCYETSTLKVWVLEDYKAGIWTFQHSVEFKDWVPHRRFITTKLKKFLCHYGKLRVQGLIKVLGMHPSSSDVIYLHVPGYILLFELPTKAVKLACRTPVAVAKKYKHYLSLFYSFPITFQIWPTPLPPLTQGLEIRLDTTHALALEPVGV